jgi:hypothetical protein
MSSPATLTTTITETEVRQLATQWYRKLDVHAPLVELLPMVHVDAEMKFPEATLRGLADFEAWYERVIRIFFDEVHTVRDVQVEPQGESVRVKVVVRWEASVWTPPAAYSQRIKLDAYQTWTVRRDEVTDRPVITEYIVDELVFDDDSARL